MALRNWYCIVALGLAMTAGCANRSNYQPACGPAVVATAPVAPACAPVPPPPPAAVIVQPR